MPCQVFPNEFIKHLIRWKNYYAVKEESAIFQDEPKHSKTAHDSIQTSVSESVEKGHKGLQTPSSITQQAA